MTRADTPLRIRLPAELKSKVQVSAVGSRRSMNAEIVARLEQSFREEVRTEPLPPPDQEKRLTNLEQVVIGILVDRRLVTIEGRLSALEKKNT